MGYTVPVRQPFLKSVCYTAAMAAALPLLCACMHTGIYLARHGAVYSSGKIELFRLGDPDFWVTSAIDAGIAFLLLIICFRHPLLQRWMFLGLLIVRLYFAFAWEISTK